MDSRGCGPFEARPRTQQISSGLQTKVAGLEYCRAPSQYLKATILSKRVAIIGAAVRAYDVSASRQTRNCGDVDRRAAQDGGGWL